jgi:hypothetical protein
MPGDLVVGISVLAAPERLFGMRRAGAHLTPACYCAQPGNAG